MPTTTPEQRNRADDHRWRMLAARVLVDLETEAAGTDLPVLDWTVHGASLIGRPLPGAGDQTRTAWQAWVDHLDAEVDDEHELSTGTRVLRASAQRSPGPGHIDVTVTLIAELASDEDD